MAQFDHQSFLLDTPIYGQDGFPDSTANHINSPIPPLVNGNGIAHSTGNLPRNDAPTSSTDETPASLTRLLKQLVELYIEARKETNEANAILREVKTISQQLREELRRREEESRRREEEWRKRDEMWRGRHEKCAKVMEEVWKWTKTQENTKKRTLEPPQRGRHHPFESDIRSRDVTYSSQNLGQFGPTTEQPWPYDNYMGDPHPMGAFR
ncbi:hypothetical protein COCC4DRAFT_51965 [Bipolaris maydis ATCC 48331]|uniref:Uncharacterized protein n=2 Tax=Cochliobolus heterostrophus TaxID=5016 RepID=M2TY65_COCH5|nr:uncharacterized protein COCC4DRAFT_51965 [Bipolaris maydis ATCC 48331]EMD86731.1 hypothetical protein COCHEDRAFT_1207146 [Bipolaris maydis C5]KAJ5047749.1 hypothetical protein J3E74DRAFT_391113 [Bipolaris maydis]ENI03120.1 hypothetical protein COCC4DRAFT_51965 [Bipolaris maydis ATCC 48331]KAJ5052544.1 hypothetical protein J3E74DRAFT_387732 [Bipolaris maydis]KAJ6192225.1 hypothetical protein J3E72DRAFT_389737 [Bipolaris maydis]